MSFSIIFLGTPSFACPSLEVLSQKEEVVGVITQPSPSAGRGRKITFSPIKELAEKKNIPVYETRNVNNIHFLAKIRKTAPEIIVVVAFGQILSPDFLSIPEICSLNVHPSLLPLYRGPAPIPRAIMHGDKKTGVSIQIIEKGIDKGKIIVQEETPINISDTTKDLEERLSWLGADLLLKAIGMIREGKDEYLAQNEEEASYAPKIKKEDGLIRWEKSAYDIHNLVRALNPYPGAFTFAQLRGRKSRLKIWQTELIEEEYPGKEKMRPGEVIGIKKGEGLLVKGGDGILLIKRAQLAGRNSISGYDFVKGYQIKKGLILGEE